MKLVTFINLAYSELAYNLYLQLKKLNIHENLVIFCLNIDTLNHVQKYNLDCEVKLYKPLLFANQKISDSLDKNDPWTGTIDYTTCQFVKQDCFYQSLLNNEFVCLIDADMIVFDNFIDDLKNLMLNQRKFIHHHGQDEYVLFALKYYSGLNINMNMSASYLYGWCGQSQIVNCGFQVAQNYDETLKCVEEYCELYKPHIGKTHHNIDEIIITNYFATRLFHSDKVGWGIPRLCSISDQINSLNNIGEIYTPEQVLNLNCKTFHPTHCGDKINFIKQCGQWFV
jgi:hypothetical protein